MFVQTFNYSHHLSYPDKRRDRESNQAQINLMIDPEAAKIALNADFPSITIAGNVANQVMIDQEYLDDVYKVKNPYTEIFHKYYDIELPFWDESAAALMVDPSISLNQSTGMIPPYHDPFYFFFFIEKIAC